MKHFRKKHLDLIERRKMNNKIITEIRLGIDNKSFQDFFVNLNEIFINIEKTIELNYELINMELIEKKSFLLYEKINNYNFSIRFVKLREKEN